MGCQRAVLGHPAVCLFLTHGGQSSVNEGLAAGVPLVCLPLFCDQYEMAEAVFRHGLGLVYHKDEAIAGQSERLSQLLQRAAMESQFSEMAGRYAHLLRLRAGSGRGAEVIESIVHAGASFQELWRGPLGRDDRQRESPGDSCISAPAAENCASSVKKESSSLRFRSNLRSCNCIDGLKQWALMRRAESRTLART